MKQVIDKLKELLSVGNFTENQITKVIEGWRNYFHNMCIVSDEIRIKEFDAIMQARVQSGSISCIAPLDES